MRSEKLINQILIGSGFEEDKTFKAVRFLKPPKTTYAVFMDSFTRRGSDGKNFIKDHTYTIELYCYAPDPEAEARIEASLDSFGLEYEKADRYWIQEEQLYQVVYTFDYIEK